VRAGERALDGGARRPAQRLAARGDLGVEDEHLVEGELLRPDERLGEVRSARSTRSTSCEYAASSAERSALALSRMTRWARMVARVTSCAES